jgi:hypothetical protein
LDVCPDAPTPLSPQPITPAAASTQANPANTRGRALIHP